MYDLRSPQIIGFNVTWPSFKVSTDRYVQSIFPICDMCFCQVLGTDAVYRVIIDPPGEVVANVTADNCSGETCYYTYISNTLTDITTVTVDVVGCTITRLDSRNISTCKRVNS